ncbi:MAG: glutamate-5-semialdehyde dehydrogenase [Treponema sp.]|nr:glutamate-5-semialdehyde dehydrogenase [Treponema sp.]
MQGDIHDTKDASLQDMFASLKKAQAELALQNREQKDAGLYAAAAAIDVQRDGITRANKSDVERAKESGMNEALVDRLFLDDGRITGIINGIKNIALLDDPAGNVKGWKTPSGLLIERITEPLGVAAIIYESRPNVTADAFALAYKAGCSILLRGSRAALESNRAITAAIKSGLEKAGGIPAAVELAQGNRDDIDQIIRARGYIDVVLPRGGHDLIRRVVENSRVPVIETGEGNCHIYVDQHVQSISGAVKIIANAKLQKPGACNAVETILVHRAVCAGLMPSLAGAMAGRCELRCDAESKAAIAQIPAGLVVRDAVDEDWKTEFLDFILAVKTVDSLDEAIAHINQYGTRHSEAILSGSLDASERFCARVDAACVYVNASTRFTDGGEFGFGAELGISTQKFHARGPMGLEALTTIKYRVSGQGHIRK